MFSLMHSWNQGLPRGSSPALVVDGELVAAAEEARFSHIKRWAGFPAESIRWCLQEDGVEPRGIRSRRGFIQFERRGAAERFELCRAIPLANCLYGRMGRL